VSQVKLGDISVFQLKDTTDSYSGGKASTAARKDFSQPLRTTINFLRRISSM
jgi:hypothetical protein